MENRIFSDIKKQKKEMNTQIVYELFGGILEKQEQLLLDLFSKLESKRLASEESGKGGFSLSALDSLLVQKLMSEEALVVSLATNLLKGMKDNIMGSLRNIN